MILFLLKLYACINMFAFTVILLFNEFQTRTAPEIPKNIFKNPFRF